MFPICRSDFPLNWQNKWELSRILPEQYVSISLPKLTSAVRAVSTQSWPFSCRHPGWGTTVSGKLTSMEQFGQQNPIHTDFYGIPEKWCYIARPMQSPASHPSSYSTQSYHRIELLVYFAAHHIRQAFALFLLITHYILLSFHYHIKPTVFAGTIHATSILTLCFDLTEIFHSCSALLNEHHRKRIAKPSSFH